MLFRMARRAQWNGVPIGRLHPDAAIGSCTDMRGFGWSRFAAGDARKLTDKSQVLPSPVQVGLAIASRDGLGDA